MRKEGTTDEEGQLLPTDVAVALNDGHVNHANRAKRRIVRLFEGVLPAKFMTTAGCVEA